jgi:hypothetical protein
MGTGELVGRDAILDVLSDALTVAADRGGAFLLLGEPGIGKTACLATAEAMARESGHLVLGTAGTEAETKLPFAGLHRLLQPLLASIGALPDFQRQALLTVLGLHEGGPPDRFVVSVAVLNLLRDASEHRTLLITADEIQWLDQDTRYILAFVTRHWTGAASSWSPRRQPSRDCPTSAMSSTRYSCPGSTKRPRGASSTFAPLSSTTASASGS